MSQADSEMLGHAALIRPAMLDVNVDDVSESQQLQWIRSTIADVATVQSGMGFPKSFQGKVEDKYPVYKVGDVSRSVLNNRGNLAIAGNSVSEMEATKLKGIIFPEGTTLFAKIGEAVRLNRRAFVVKPGLADNNVMGVKPLLREMDKIIYYLMRTVDLNEVSRSTTVPSIRKSDIEDLIFNIPPLAEQQQIAAKLDELLAQVDNLKTRLDTIPKIIKRFRQSVLAAAVSGKLTEDWHATKSLSVVVTIGEVASDIRYGTSKKCDYEKGNTPVIRIPNIDNGFLNLTDMKFADFDDKELNSLSLVVGDLLLIRSNGSVDLVGKTALISEKDVHCLYAGYLIRIRLNQQLVVPKYVLYCLQSSQIRKIIEMQARSTSGVNNINSKELAALPFLRPSLQEQTEIVSRVEQLFAYADQIEQRVKDAQSRVNHLTQAVLAKAFRGELTAEWRAQNPELISGENSAVALLARIKAEREQIQTVKKAKM